MKQHDFEKRVLHLWMTTRVPLTRANLLYFTGVPRQKLERWLDEMVREGVLDVDSDDAGEMIWTVRGADRPARGLSRVEDVAKMESLSSQVSAQRGGGGGALARASDVAEMLGGRAPRGMSGEKSVALSALLGVFGPLGWLYAGPAREVVPAAIIYYLAFAILPFWIFLPFQGVLTALSVGAGAVYAWQHNKNGQPTPLFTDDDGRPRLPGRR